MKFSSKKGIFLLCRYLYNTYICMQKTTREALFEILKQTHNNGEKQRPYTTLQIFTYLIF